ncbi:Chaperone protein dnaJ [Coemansia spiralis]|uniref:Chaperone protein dnaJ n=2 Tax=Coemansia TaxID=4863 RepID=A0A9W8G5C1_9FUNG|nr:Chaperone protein dnaJ [Coemansia umbellata]KAJ2623894.1 Chaperone protein dnaJ [Coemansia sp. RSA 1358]KAJ2679318.1 Chaperone protein dnaJ [Coemansia spiralis]
MEVNRDEAQRALLIAQDKWRMGDTAAALRLARKSHALYPTPQSTQLIKEYSGTNRTEKEKPPQPSPEVKEEVKKDRFTDDQVTAVAEIMKVKSDYYRVLGVDRAASSVELKKAYRKRALLFHPDKNTAPGADEAFKLVAHAFTVLSDKDKRLVYDRGGMREEWQQTSNSRGQRATRQAYREEVSPEDLFNMFFGGDLGQFHVQFGPNGRFAGRPRNTQRQAHNEESSIWSSCMQLMPLMLLVLSFFATSILSFLFSDSAPGFSFEPTRVYAVPRHTRQYNVGYWVNSNEFSRSSVAKTPQRLRQFERDVEAHYVSQLQLKCRREREHKQAQIYLAQGWFGVDQERLREAEGIPLPACEELRRFR